jgi:nitrite reductase/ring-hydroxylating ferredoxin subunit
MTTHEDERSSEVSRRMMLRGATVGGVALPFLAACGGGDSASSSDDATSSAGPSPSEASPSEEASGGGAAAGTIAVADVPVGGGTVVKAEKVVVVQPTAGDFKAFSAVCTHQGCTVGKVEDGEIVCPCHGSHFSIEDGSPVAGPAQKPLEAKTATVQGDQISVT